MIHAVEKLICFILTWLLQCWLSALWAPCESRTNNSSSEDEDDDEDEDNDNGEGEDDDKYNGVDKLSDAGKCCVEVNCRVHRRFFSHPHTSGSCFFLWRK